MNEVKAIVVSDTCSHCEKLKEKLKERGLLDKVKLIDVSTKEGYEFAEQHDIKAVPECVVVIDSEGKKARTCTDEEFMKLVTEGQ